MTEASMGDAPRDVRITTVGPQASVTVDGTDLSDALLGYQLDHRANQMPFLALFAKPGGGGLLFEGMAQVAVATEPDRGQAVADFLSSIDPVALERAALERDDLSGDRHEVSRAMLAQLIDWAKGV